MSILWRIWVFLLMIGLCKLKQKGSLGLTLVRATVATSYKDFEDIALMLNFIPIHLHTFPQQCTLFACFSRWGPLLCSLRWLRLHSLRKRHCVDNTIPIQVAPTLSTTIFGGRILEVALSALLSTPSRIRASHGPPLGTGPAVRTMWRATLTLGWLPWRSSPSATLAASPVLWSGTMTTPTSAPMSRMTFSPQRISTTILRVVTMNSWFGMCGYLSFLLLANRTKHLGWLDTAQFNPLVPRLQQLLLGAPNGSFGMAPMARRRRTALSLPTLLHLGAGTSWTFSITWLRRKDSQLKPKTSSVRDFKYRCSKARNILIGYTCSSCAIRDRAIHWSEVYLHCVKLVCQGGINIPLTVAFLETVHRWRSSMLDEVGRHSRLKRLEVVWYVFTPWLYMCPSYNFVLRRVLELATLSS